MLKMMRRPPNTSRSHSVNFTRMLLNISQVGNLGRQHITLAASRVNQWLISPVINLPAETLYIDVYNVGKRIEVFVPDVFGDLCATQDLTLMNHQQLEQGIFFRRKIDNLIPPVPRLSHPFDRKIP